MPYSRTFVKMRINGVFGTDVATSTEKWSTGVNISSLGGGSFDPAQLSQFLVNVAADVSTFHAASDVKAGQNCLLTELTAAYIGTDGLYVLGALQPTTRYTYASPVLGASVAIHPITTALVISLRSLRLRGPASHGRMYYPALGLGVSNVDGTVSTAALNLYLPKAKALIDAINSKAGASFGTASKVSLVSKVGAGAEAVVTSILIDQKMDHMESRERSIPSIYRTTTTAVAAAAISERDEDLRRQFDELESAEPS